MARFPLEFEVSADRKRVPVCLPVPTKALSALMTVMPGGID